MKKRGSLLGLLISIVLAAPVRAVGWTTYHGDLVHSGVSQVDTIQNKGQLVWRFKTRGTIPSSPAIGPDGAIYVGSVDKSLYAVNSNGTLRWAYQTGGSVMSSPAIGTDGAIYFGSLDNYLYALNYDGTLRWRYLAGGTIRFSSPAIGPDGTVYVGSTDGNLYAINSNGTLKWTFASLNAKPFDSSPAVGPDGTVYAGAYDARLYAINPNGTLRCAVGNGNSQSSATIAPDGTVYIGSYDNNLYAISLTPCGWKWRYATADRLANPPPSVIQNSPAFNGTIYFGTYDQTTANPPNPGGVWALDTNGNFLWKFTINAGVSTSSLAVGADGTIFAGSRDHNLYAVNPNGTLRWSYTTGGMMRSSPAIGADGTVYVGSDDMYL
jgi:outer membrane protein assembly factor BamB